MTRWSRQKLKTFDTDSPITSVSDWDGAILKQGGVVTGRVKNKTAADVRGIVKVPNSIDDMRP